LRAIEARLLHEGCRLVSVVGIGGVGKTRLALEAAAALKHAFAEGACFVPLADAKDGAEVIAAVLRQLGLPLLGGLDTAAQLIHVLRRRHLLLVLDNFEHLLHDAEAVALLQDLLAAAPHLALLVTSRERLNLQEEWIQLLDGLPPDGPTIALFADRTRRGGHDAPLDAASVAKICQLVEGLPLAVELAATWTRLMTPEQIVAQLVAGLDLLSTRLRTSRSGTEASTPCLTSPGSC
jgi:predicted ATPase